MSKYVLPNRKWGGLGKRDCYGGISDKRMVRRVIANNGALFFSSSIGFFRILSGENMRYIGNGNDELRSGKGRQTLSM